MLNREALERYVTIKAEAKRLKELEMELRREIARELAGEKPIGTHKFVVGDESHVKVKISHNMNVDREMLDSMWSILSTDEADCVKWTPTIIMKGYKECATPNLDKCITTTPAAPTVEVSFDE